MCHSRFVGCLFSSISQTEIVVALQINSIKWQKRSLSKNISPENRRDLKCRKQFSARCHHASTRKLHCSAKLLSHMVRTNTLKIVPLRIRLCIDSGESNHLEKYQSKVRESFNSITFPSKWKNSHFYSLPHQKFDFSIFNALRHTNEKIFLFDRCSHNKYYVMYHN
jgi:hypothetical protein